MNVKNCEENEYRWNYRTYRLIMWLWMMNEFAVVFSTASISHHGFYVYGTIYTLGVIFIGIPLVYSEICVAQYTNCNVVTMWNFFPILKGVGWTSLYLVILKIIFTNVLSSWYLIYTFYGTYDPPPWFSCISFNDSMCIMKSINVSAFQHCLEAQTLFHDDCGMKTASKCFFDKIIGDNTTYNEHTFLWKPLIANFTSSIIAFIFYIKRKKILNFITKFLILFVGIIVFVLLWVSLSIDGVWFSKKIRFHLEQFVSISTLHILQLGFLSCGTGYGIIGYLSHDVSFRSPATMTSIAVPLFSLFLTILMSLIIYITIKVMSYYHGEEENILERDDNIFFMPYASVAEIFTYIKRVPIWSFIWFITIYLFLLMNLWILYSFLIDNLKILSKFGNTYTKWTWVITTFMIQFITYPFYYSDLNTALADVIEILQLFNSFLFSMSIYWIYGFKKHIIDITFMIGVKASYFWKIAWILNPLYIALSFYLTCTKSFVTVTIRPNNKLVSVDYKLIIFYVLISLYVLILGIGIVYQFIHFYKNDEIKNIFIPDASWGPRDEILLKSRKMFVPEIMTREFLYRQVKIHGYCRKRSTIEEPDNMNELRKESVDQTEWNALTSN